MIENPFTPQKSSLNAFGPTPLPPHDPHIRVSNIVAEFVGSTCTTPRPWQCRHSGGIVCSGVPGSLAPPGSFPQRVSSESFMRFTSCSTSPKLTQAKWPRAAAMIDGRGRTYSTRSGAWRAPSTPRHHGRAPDFAGFDQRAVTTVKREPQESNPGYRRSAALFYGAMRP